LEKEGKQHHDEQLAGIEIGMYEHYGLTVQGCKDIQHYAIREGTCQVDGVGGAVLPSGHLVLRILLRVGEEKFLEVRSAVGRKEGVEKKDVREKASWGEERGAGVRNE